MIIKTILIGIIFFTIKSIIILTLFIFYLINKESNNILNSTKYDSEIRKGNYELRPINFYTTPNDLPIGTIIYYKYWNEVFNLTYLKILSGHENFWLEAFKKIKFNSWFYLLLWYYIDLSRNFIKISLEIVKYKEKNIEEFLFLKFSNVLDDRLIIKLEDKWIVNGFVTETSNKAKLILLKKNNLSTSNINLAMPHIIKIIEKNKDKTNKNYLQFVIKQGIFLDKKNKTPHSHIKNICKNDDFIGYITDQQKADFKKNYNLRSILEKVELEKKSKVLEIPKSEIILYGEEKTVNSRPFLESAYRYPYSEDLVKDEFKESVFEYTTIKDDIYSDLKELINDESLVNELNEMITKELFDNLNKVIKEIIK